MTTPLSEIEARLAEIEEACNAVCSKCNGSKTETRKAYSAGWYDVECLCRLCKGTGKQEIDERIPYLLQQVRALSAERDALKVEVAMEIGLGDTARDQLAKMREAAEVFTDHLAYLELVNGEALPDDFRVEFIPPQIRTLAAVTQDSGEVQ